MRALTSVAGLVAIFTFACGPMDIAPADLDAGGNSIEGEDMAGPPALYYKYTVEVDCVDDGGHLRQWHYDDEFTACYQSRTHAINDAENKVAEGVICQLDPREDGLDNDRLNEVKSATKGDECSWWERVFGGSGAQEAEEPAI